MPFKNDRPCIDCGDETLGQRHRCEPCRRAKWRAANKRYKATEAGKAATRRAARKVRARAYRAKTDPIPVDFAGQTCAWCETAPAEVVDHVIPLAKGGDDTHMNKVPACRACNAAKSDLTPLEYL